MLLSIDGARNTVPKYWWTICGLNVVTMAVFLFSMYEGLVLAEFVFYSFCAVAVIGLLIGMGATFRFSFNSTIGLFGFIYYFSIGFLFSSSASSLVMVIADRPELRWFAFNISALCVLFTLFCGMYLEFKALCLLEGANYWRKEVESYIDYSKRQIKPALTGDTSNFRKVKYPYIIVAVGVTNIPLLFEFCGGEKVSAVYLAAPLLTGTFVYLNFKTFGPALVRILLLRKIEKEVGYRFQNADYEKIQELRRGFVLARWLMKDYRPPQTQAAACVSEIHKDNVVKKKKQKRRK